MTLYRASPGDGVAWITGASTGIGRQLALELARKGYKVAVSARKADELYDLSAVTGQAGTITAFPVDVTDDAGMRRTVDRIERELGPIALAVFNAGASYPTRGANLNTENFVRTFQINVFGVVNGLVPVVERMNGRGKGQIVIVGSVTAYFGLPHAGAYGATKAALNNMAEALKYDFDKMNLRLQIVNPGFVKTPLTDKNRFRMPALMTAENAARRLARGIERGGFEITFPRRFTWPLKTLRLLPQPVQYWIISRVSGWNRLPPGASWGGRS